MNRQKPLCRRTLWLTVVGLAVGCNSYKSDMENLCHSVERSKVQDRPIDKANVLTAAESWAGERARSKDGQALLSAIAHVDPGSKAQVIRDAAREAGVSNCPFADAVEAAVREGQVQREGE
ncbi:hypothetical protein ACN469_12330 [Corallococcus terminator]